MFQLIDFIVKNVNILSNVITVLSVFYLIYRMNRQSKLRAILNDKPLAVNIDPEKDVFKRTALSTASSIEGRESRFNYYWDKNVFVIKNKDK